MIHVWHTFADVVPEGREAIERIAGFPKPPLELSLGSEVDRQGAPVRDIAVVERGV